MWMKLTNEPFPDATGRSILFLNAESGAKILVAARFQRIPDGKEGERFLDADGRPVIEAYDLIWFGDNDWHTLRTLPNDSNAKSQLGSAIAHLTSALKVTNQLCDLSGVAGQPGFFRPARKLPEGA